MNFIVPCYLDGGLVRNGLKWRGFLRAVGLHHYWCERFHHRRHSSEKAGDFGHSVGGQRSGLQRKDCINRNPTAESSLKLRRGSKNSKQH